MYQDYRSTVQFYVKKEATTFLKRTFVLIKLVKYLPGISTLSNHATVINTHRVTAPKAPTEPITVPTLPQQQRPKARKAIKTPETLQNNNLVSWRCEREPFDGIDGKARSAGSTAAMHRKALK